MNKQAAGQNVKTKEQNNQALLAEYIQHIKGIKAQNAQDMTQLTQILKERNADLKRMRQDNELLKGQVSRHGEDFKKFRGILSELKSRASSGNLSNDVIHGSEMKSLNKEREKLTSMYKQEAQKNEKLESRCQAMSAQIIDRQKKIYQLEGLFSESEKQRQTLESVLTPLPVESFVAGNERVDVKQMIKRVVEVIQGLTSQMPGWLKT